jgi:hypothetical protein
VSEPATNRENDREPEPAGWQHDQKPEGFAPKRVADDAVDHEVEVDEAWRVLLHEHMAFLEPDDAAAARLFDGLRELERLFLADEDPAARAYYDETTLAPLPGATPVDVGSLGAAMIGRTRLRHLARLQAQLMEQTFLTLRLDRFANAPANAGWMNLFRRWARSATFNDWFERFRPTLRPAFQAFYDRYVVGHDDIERDPMPHPWDPPAPVARGELASRRERAWRQQERSARTRAAPFLDSGAGPAEGTLDNESLPDRTDKPGAGAAAEQSRSPAKDTDTPPAPTEDAGAPPPAPNA